MDDVSKDGKPLSKRERKAQRKAKLRAIDEEERKVVHREIEIKKASQIRNTLKLFVTKYLLLNIFIGSGFLCMWFDYEPDEAVVLTWITFIYILVIPGYWGNVILKSINFPRGLYDFSQIDAEYERKYPWYHEEMNQKRKRRQYEE